MTRATLFGDPTWLHTPNPELADALEHERHGFGFIWAPATTPAVRDYGDTDADRAARNTAIDAELHPRRRAA